MAPDGSFWVGTMQDNIADDGTPKAAPDRTGRLYRISADGSVASLTERPFGITNTIIWTDDGGFVTADTAVNEIYRFEYDATMHRLLNPVPVAKGLARGIPDGSTRDADGNIYNCRVAGGNSIAVLSPKLAA